MMTPTKALEAGWSDIMAIEDFLQEKGVFINGISGKPAHADSYMTCVDFVALNAVKATNPFIRAQWAEAVKYWNTNPNMQPPLRIVAFLCKTLA